MPLTLANDSNPRSPSPEALRSALKGDEDAFAAVVEPLRREIQTHCYRMLGTLEDAEDLVQETFIKAWRRLETYDGRASFRAWLYKIATNACLDSLRRLPRRALPNTTQPPADPFSPPLAPVLEPVWIQPYPDEWIAPLENDPEARFTVQESISLAFTVALQVLPPRQRCALILADVLDWSAVEIGEIMEVTVSAVHSLLHRARTTLKQHFNPEKRSSAEMINDDQTIQMLERYLRAWEVADIETIISLLTEDARFPMPPLPGWYLGRAAIRDFIATTILAGDSAHRWRLQPFRANRQPGAAFYQLDSETGRYLPFALQVLELRAQQIVEAVTFGYPQLFAKFGLPSEIDAG